MLEGLVGLLGGPVGRLGRVEGCACEAQDLGFSEKKPESNSEKSVVDKTPTGHFSELSPSLSATGSRLLDYKS